MSRQKPVNVPSLLLTNAENQWLFALIDQKCVSQASAVVQVFVSNTKADWHKLSCGVACFIKDYNEKSYYIKVYNLKVGTTMMSEEIRPDTPYIVKENYFHTFQGLVSRHGKSHTIGLNFASEDEAHKLNQAVCKMKTRNDNQSQNFTTLNRGTGLSSMEPSDRRSADDNTKSDMFQITPHSSSKLVHKRVSKEDIGKPVDFRCVHHIGWEPDKGYDMTLIEQDMRNIFMKVGIVDEYVDSSTYNFVHNCIQIHGGMDTIKSAIATEEKRDEVVKSPQTKKPPSRPPPSLPSKVVNPETDNQTIEEHGNPRQQRPTISPPGVPISRRPGVPPPAPPTGEPNEIPPKISSNNTPNVPSKQVTHGIFNIPTAPALPGKKTKPPTSVTQTRHSDIPIPPALPPKNDNGRTPIDRNVEMRAHVQPEHVSLSSKQDIPQPTSWTDVMDSIVSGKQRENLQRVDETRKSQTADSGNILDIIRKRLDDRRKYINEEQDAFGESTWSDTECDTE